MSVGGDTLSGVAQLVQGLQTGATGGRPMSLDLLWQVRGLLGQGGRAECEVPGAAAAAGAAALPC